MQFRGNTSGPHAHIIEFAGEAMQGGSGGGLSQIEGWLTESINGVRGHQYNGETGLGIGYQAP